MSEGSATTDAALRRELETLRAENERLRSLLGLDERRRSEPVTAWEPTLLPPDDGQTNLLAVDQRSPREAKLALFRTLFAGRDDVYAQRWEHRGTGRSGWSPAVVGGPANSRNPRRQYEPFTDAVVEAHLRGRLHAGLYPLLPGDRCRLLAADFDGPGWALDALAYLDAARTSRIPMALERSRSGEGAHVWAFFSAPVPAAAARRVGMHLLREAMTVRAELDLASYDRLFPAQDFLPRGSFGNLIALPLQGACRRQSTTVFLDPATLEPYEDQWAFLSALGRSSPEAIVAFAESLPPIGAGPDEGPYRRPRAGLPSPQPPATIRATAGAMLALERSGIPPALLAGLKHLASLHNPAYYEKERLRLSTWRTPRFLRSYRETLDQLLLPRGVREQAAQIVAQAGSRLEVVEGCSHPASIPVELRTRLSEAQRQAVASLARHELGVLVAPPGAGKTVIACALIAQHRLPTLVLVDRQPLIEQWRARLVEHLAIDRKAIGQLGGGRRRATGVIDLAMVQSLARRDDLPQITSAYGLAVVDECHHVPAVTFERCVRQMPVAHWLGLTATPYRRDRLEGLIAMYCGPIRHRMTAQDPEAGALEHRLLVHSTEHAGAAPDALDIQAAFRSLVEDDVRTAQICSDIVRAADAGRNCLVLSQWTAHVERLATGLRELGHEPLVLHGGLGKRACARVVDELERGDRRRGILLVATGSFLGEGFDCPTLDTLFLAFPLAFKGRLVQYVGRILRPAEAKSSVEVHDYADANVPVLARMHAKRLPAFASLGFDVSARRGPSGMSRTRGSTEAGTPGAWEARSDPAPVSG